MKAIQIHPQQVGSRRHQTDLIRGIDVVHGHPVIDRSFPLEAIADASRQLAATSARSSSNSDTSPSRSKAP